MDVLSQLTDRISQLLERQESLKWENAEFRETLEQER